MRLQARHRLAIGTERGLVSPAPDTSPAEAEEKYGTWAFPLVYLAQIGVRNEVQRGQGVGSAMMLDAFERTLTIADLAGTFGLMLDAIDDDRALWYERLDFKRFDA